MAALLDPTLLEDSVLSFCGGIAIGMIACLIILGLFGDNKYVRWALYFLERAGLLEAVQRTGGSPPFVHNDEATRLANTHHYIVACHERMQVTRSSCGRAALPQGPPRWLPR